MYNVTIDDRAMRKFENAVEFLSRVSESATDNLIHSFLSSLNQLQEHPTGYAYYTSNEYPDIEMHKILFSRWHRLVFTVADDAVHVFDVQDCRQSDEMNLA